jgi:N-acyl homoserine lactone hydrolase
MTMKLYLFQLATLQPDDVPVPAYLVQTDEGQNILIDSGFPAFFAGNPVELPGSRTAYMDTDGFIVNRLATIGVRPEDVHIVICTHLDADHAGGHASFPNAEFVVQKTNYELALTSVDPRFAALRQTWDQPHLRYRTVEGDIELVPGVELIESSGHVPGHQAVLLQLPKTGTVLLSIDAVPHSTMTDADTRWVMPIYDMDESATRASTRKLMKVVQRENVALTIYGHDAGQWATLKHAPAYYD